MLLAGLLLISLLIQLFTAWWAHSDQQRSVEQTSVVKDALWVRGELHAMAAAETLWLAQGAAEPLLRAQRNLSNCEAIFSCADLANGRAEGSTLEIGHR